MAAPTSPPFAELLRRFRRDRGLTQEALAELAGLSVRGIRALEQGERTAPHTDTVHLLAAALQLSANDRTILYAAARILSGGPAARRDLAPPTGGFLGAQSSGPLIARHDELGELLRIIEEVERGEGRMILLHGEAGVGKTRLAQEVAVHLRNRGFVIASGRCYEPEQAIAYYPFLDALTMALAAAPSSVLAAIPSRWPSIGWLLPDLIDPPDATRIAGQNAQQLLFRAVTGFLETMAAVAPLALMVDDVHWADNASLMLLLHLARHTRTVRILLLGTYRETEVGKRHPLTRALLDLHREELTEHTAVRRLAEEGTGALIAATLGAGEVSGDLVALVHRRTDGNPFFVKQMLRAMVEQGDAYRREERWERRPGAEAVIPENLRTVIHQRVSRLGVDTQAALHEASVLGQTFLYGDLHAMADRPDEDLENALSEAEEAGLVRVRGEDSYAFDHALTQEALYGDLTPPRRRRLHVAVGEALERLPEGARTRRAAELAWHFLRGGDAQRALPYALLAGDRAGVVFAHAEAERHYHTALELARETGRRPQEAEALHKLGRVLTDVGRYEEAREALTGAARLYRELSDQPGEVWATVQLGSVHRALGTSGAGITQVRALLTRLETGGRPQDITELYIVLETLHYATGHYREGLAAADRASELAQSTAEGAALARAETGRGTELLMLGRLDEGLRALEGAIVLGEASDDPYNLARALDNAAAGYRSRGNPGRSREIVERLLALQEPLQNPWGLAIALSGVGATYRQLGDWARARTYLEQGEQLRRALPPSLWAIYLLLELAALNLDEGRRGLGSEQVEEALSLARRSGHLEGIRAGEHALAELDLFEGRPELARERLEPLLDRSGLEELQVTEMLPTLAAAYAASGANPRLVDEAIQAAVRRATASNSMRSLASALLVRGRVLAARGQWTAAVCDLEESVRLARNMPYPYLEARGLFEWGLTCGKQGKPEKARERLEEALETFQRLGARPYVERTERVRDEIGPA